MLFSSLLLLLTKLSDFHATAKCLYLFLSQILAVCREAALLALQEDIAAQHIESKHFESALKIVIPRVPDSLIQLYINYQHQHNRLDSF